MTCRHFCHILVVTQPSPGLGWNGAATQGVHISVGGRIYLSLFTDNPKGNKLASPTFIISFVFF